MIQIDPITKEVLHPLYGAGILRDSTKDEVFIVFPGCLYLWESIKDVAYSINAESIWRNHKCRTS